MTEIRDSTTIGLINLAAELTRESLRSPARCQVNDDIRFVLEQVIGELNTRADHADEMAAIFLAGAALEMFLPGLARNALIKSQAAQN